MKKKSNVMTALPINSVFQLGRDVAVDAADVAAVDVAAPSVIIQPRKAEGGRGKDRPLEVTDKGWVRIVDVIRYENMKAALAMKPEGIDALTLTGFPPGVTHGSVMPLAKLWAIEAVGKLPERNVAMNRMRDLVSTWQRATIPMPPAGVVYVPPSGAYRNGTFVQGAFREGFSYPDQFRRRAINGAEPFAVLAPLAWTPEK